MRESVCPLIGSTCRFGSKSSRKKVEKLVLGRQAVNSLLQVPFESDRSETLRKHQFLSFFSVLFAERGADCLQAATKRGGKNNKSILGGLEKEM
jgi:hypothetical protein